MQANEERKIKLVISYDGTDFRGWQIQKNDRTVQGEIERALAELHKRKITSYCAGRTDSGVHAAGQVAHFSSDIATIPDARFAPALNSLLPRDVRVLSSVSVSEAFHARYSAVKRTYRYYFYHSSVAPPYIDRYCHCLGTHVNVRKLNDLARVLIGTHDFETFAAVGEDERTTVRSIYDASFFTQGAFLVFQISGNGFLRRMVRSVVGTLLELAFRDRKPEDMNVIIATKNRELAGTTAPSKGLFLYHVDYTSTPGKNHE